MDLEKARRAYANDPVYRALVDTMAGLISTLEMTPAEVRQAAIFACILVEERSMRPIFRARSFWKTACSRKGLKDDHGGATANGHAQPD